MLPRFVVMPDGERFVPLEQVIAAHLDTLFPGMTIGEHDAFRVTRNADLALEEDEADDLLVAVEMELRRRRFGRAVRLEIAAAGHARAPRAAGRRAGRARPTASTPSTPRSTWAGCGRSTASTGRTSTRRPGRR